MTLLRWAVLVALAGAALLAVTFAGVMAAERHAFRTLSHTRPADLDAVIVLGGGMAPDGAMNHRGRDRVRAARHMLAEGHAEVAIMSGGAGIGPLFAEAVQMASYAREIGMAEDRILLEPRSLTTLENLRFSFRLAEARGLERLGIVTSAFHLHRALMLARLLGRGDVEGFAAEPVPERFILFSRLGPLVRETLAWWFNLGKAAGWIGLGALGWSEAERGAVIR
jgi:uncharacterized SAM-binding protein YcdF (DUF218 family)